MKIYIAGKISGLERKAVEEKFENAKKTLSLKGYQVFIPTILPFYDEVSHEDYLHICYSIIDVCDAVFMLKDWQESEGAKKELQYAYNHNKKILYEEEKNSGKMCCINEADKLRQLREMFPESAQKYRPFKDCEELIETWKKKNKSEIGCDIHYPSLYQPCIWIKNRKRGSLELIVGFGSKYIILANVSLDLNMLFSEYTFCDGSVCGVLE